MAEPLRTFEDLEAWKACRNLRQLVYSLVGSFPTEEKFGLVKQIRDAAASTTANIAEGFGRYHYQENIQFCRISRGSLFEILDHLITSVDSGYITAEQFEDGRSRTLHAIKVLNGYLKMLQHAKMTND